MINLLIFAGSLFWGVWVLFEAWKGQTQRILILGGMGSLGITILGSVFRVAPMGALPGPGWLILWVPSFLGFLAGRRLDGRRVYPKRLDWVEGPVEAAAAVFGLLAGFIGKRRHGRPEAKETRGHAHQEALEQVLDLGSRSVDEVMISRSEMDPLNADDEVRHWIRFTIEKRWSRFPVYREHLDQIIGLVTIRELLSTRSLTDKIGAYALPVPFVPETMKCDDLLRQLWKTGEHIAIAVDEYGGVAGLVTREDLLEILVGDLLEEPESQGAKMTRVDRRTWLADGAFRTEDFDERFSVELPDGEYETLAGLFLERLGRIPQVGERLEIHGIEMVVASRDERRIQTIKIRFLAMPPGRKEGSRESKLKEDLHDGQI
ncbi:MAG: hemolysin family protein [Candidatus Eisenbacteria bacterium]|uniref:Hemolysin family protein n=1 Tax=Eiseniibacteriota bacterium TaxID=2212470 RepID=A0A948RRJ9_UNCEI|nr:hemolysin family protein [Candidatus Eisenbacteria bacterium]MBU1948044.1 hemolysin family protein [Candidatus Eisenbacteria bacterium]MBU2689703.1 hemolysin family protein [Candidatus Eisenbacteria bacterium]